MNMKYDELKELILFPMGLPSVYHIRLGMSNYETEDYQEQLDMKETDNYTLNDFLKKYDVVVEQGFSDDLNVTEICISIPLNELSERDIRLLFDSISYKMDTVEKKFSITTDSDDSVKELESTIHSDLFDVRIYLNESHDNVVISFSTDDDVKTDMLRCLSIISKNEKSFLNDIMRYTDSHSDYWHD